MTRAWEQLNPSMADEAVDLCGCCYLLTARRSRSEGTWSVCLEAVGIDGDSPDLAWEGDITLGGAYGSPMAALQAAKVWLLAHQQASRHH